MKKGFTLTELLLALSIVGVIATLTIPVLMGNIHNKSFATQIKNMSATIEQLAQDELIVNRTRDLSDTDFGDPEKLLTDKHFSIAKSCKSENSLANCWKTTATGNEKVTYKKLNKNTISFSGMDTVILKNGAILGYKLHSTGTSIGAFYLDVNGNDKPNIGGRDLFSFYINSKGHVIDENEYRSEENNLNTQYSNCKTDYWWCYGALANNNWKMDY